MPQTHDMLRTLHERPIARPNALDQTERHAELMTVLGRIADALEQRNIIDEKMADFAAMLQRGGAPAEDVELAPDGLPRKQR